MDVVAQLFFRPFYAVSTQWSAGYQDLLLKNDKNRVLMTELNGIVLMVIKC